MSVRVPKRELIQLAGDLRTMSKRTLQYASAGALTELAARTRDAARERVKREFVLRQGREQWTLRGIQSTYTTGRRPIDRQFTIAGARNRGSTPNPMAKQEHGGAIPPTSGRKRRITTSQGSGEGDSAVPRRKLARGRLRPGNMRLANRVRTKGLTRVQRLVVTVLRARARGDRLVWLKLASKGREGIFEVRGTKKKPRIRMVHAIYRHTLRVEARPWLEPSARMVARDTAGTGLRHVALQVERDRLFRKR